MSRHHWPRFLISGLILSGLAALALRAGPLDPPAGPIAPTYKTLHEVEPRIAISAVNTPGDASSLFKITQAGSYYLAGNITGVAGKHAIAIAADGVTLDLRGFALSGVAGSFDGVTTFGVERLRLELRGGSIAGFGDRGVDFNGDGSVIADLRVQDCVSEGIRVGDAAVISRCTSSDNQGSGIECGDAGVIEHCIARSNTAHGIDAGPGTTILGCTAASNRLNGILAGAGSTITSCATSLNSDYGIDAGLGTAVRSCTSGSNGFTGIRVDIGASVTDCTAYQHSGVGILTSRVCTVTNCTAYQNAVGIGTGDGSTILNCAAYQNSSNGFGTGNACTVSNCSALENSSNGFNIASGSTITGCTARINDFDGIFCVTACVVRGNTCSSNGNGATIGAGIHVTGNDNRIEGNNCNNADVGLDVDTAGNTIIRNTCAGNGLNWSIAANNVCGPILNRIAPASAVISGDSAPSSLGTTDANANFTY